MRAQPSELREGDSGDELFTRDGPAALGRVVVLGAVALAHRIPDEHRLGPEEPWPLVPLGHRGWPVLLLAVREGGELERDGDVARPVRDDEMPMTLGDVERVARMHFHVHRRRGGKLGIAFEVDAVGVEGREAELVVEVEVELVRLVGVPPN